MGARHLIGFISLFFSLSFFFALFSSLVITSINIFTAQVNNECSKFTINCNNQTVTDRLFVNGIILIGQKYYIERYVLFQIEK